MLSMAIRNNLCVFEQKDNTKRHATITFILTVYIPSSKGKRKLVIEVKVIHLQRVIMMYIFTVMTEILGSNDDTWSVPQLKFWTLTMIHGHSYD
jgi:hypothetical protein